MSAINSVLLIEDNPGDAGLVASCLDEQLGGRCVVRQASTLAEGLQALQQGVADVVLLDLGLPDSQGLGAYHEVRRHAPRTPVVILTGDADEEQALEALTIGAEDYLSKHSADAATLLRTMQHAVHRRRLAEKLRDGEARFRAIVETAQEGILLVNRDGWVRYHNARAGYLLGPSVLGQGNRFDPVLRVHLSVRLEDEPLIDELLRTPVGARTRHELQVTRDDQSPLWVAAAAGGLSTADHGEEVVLLLTDITDQKLAAQELRALKNDLEVRVTERTAMLEAANADLRTLGRAMAHDLRTPLSGIIGMTQLVKAETQHVLPTTTWRRLELIDQSAQDMNALIGRLLALGALGNQDLQRERLDLSQMVHQIAEGLSSANPDRRVLWLISPSVTAVGDRALVADVLRNLLDNAWKYTSGLKAAIIEFGQSTLEGNVAEYFVRDNGVGFDMADAPRLFAAFSRLPTSEGFPGTGIGLAGARRIIERHGGTISAQASPGAGARFGFTLAASAAPTATA